MKQCLKKFFSRDLNDRKWYRIIAWWEIRRIAFNLTLFVSGLGGIIHLLRIHPGFKITDFNYLIHPIVIGFVIFANFLYTSGWIIELFVRTPNPKINSKIKKTFNVGIIISIGLTYILTIGTKVFIEMKTIEDDENYSLPETHFTRKEPIFDDLVGVYKIDIAKSDRISLNDIMKNPEMRLNADSSLFITNFPIFYSEYDYELYNGIGEWGIILKYEGHDDEEWVVDVLFDSLYQSQTLKSHEKLSTYFIICEKGPSYKIYKELGCPENRNGVLYKKT